MDAKNVSISGVDHPPTSNEVRVQIDSSRFERAYLNVTFTHEGIILDVCDIDTGESLGTSSEMYDEIQMRLCGEG